MKTTITEALAELKTLNARIAKKREFIFPILGRQEAFKDPHEKEVDGSRGVIARERQAVADLEERVIAIRSAIQLANREETIMVAGRTRTIQDWLVWRRDVAPTLKQFLQRVQGQVSSIRADAQKKGLGVNVEKDQKPTDVIININELQLGQEIENLETVLGTLDGQLSLKNATITIDV